MSEYIFSSVRIVDPEHGCPDWESANRGNDQSCYVAKTVYAPTGDRGNEVMGNRLSCKNL